jgi:hypothetical protein
MRPIRQPLHFPSPDYLPILSLLPHELRNGATPNSDRHVSIAQQAPHERNGRRSMGRQHDYFMLGVDLLQVWEEDRKVSIDTVMDLSKIFSSPRWIPGCGPPCRVDFWEPLLER